MSITRTTTHTNITIESTNIQNVIEHIHNGDYAYIIKHIEKIINLHDVYKNNILQIAIKAKQYDIIALLLSKYNFEFNYKNIHDETAIGIAIKNNDEKSIALLNDSIHNKNLIKINDLHYELKQLKNTKIDLTDAKKIIEKLHKENDSLYEKNSINLDLITCLSNDKEKIINAQKALINTIASVKSELNNAKKEQPNLKRILQENAELQHQNKMLKTSVENMTLCLKNKI